MSSKLEIRFYLSQSGYVDEEVATSPGEYAAGTYTFCVNGEPVNAEPKEEPNGDPNWRVENLSMSLMLLQGMTRWLKNEIKGAGCFYDYVELGLEETEAGLVEISSYLTGAPETLRKALCMRADLFAQFHQATVAWAAHNSEMLRLLEEDLTPSYLAAKPRILKNLQVQEWKAAFDAWFANYGRINPAND
jgi:hypothetical protein